MNTKIKTTLFLALCSFAWAAPASFTVQATQDVQPISPYIYGKNHDISQETGKPTSDLVIQRHKDAGYKMIRLNNGNNSTKYNWEKKLTSAPDWYNNVYSVDWDASAQEVVSKLPGVQSMYGISLLGWVADNNNHNFNDWLYNQSQWWDGVHNNWAGTPPISAAGEEPQGEANPELYLTKQSIDKTLGIMDHWFGTGANQLGLDSTLFRYWNLDNEPDIWVSTHNDVMPDTLSAEEFIPIYVEAAQKARAKFPGIKLVGPVLTNEWQWYNWQNSKVTYEGEDYSFTEFFIMRIAQEQQRLGVKLLDVFDAHYYPGYDSENDKAQIMQAHRIWFDTSYVDPKANAVKWSMGSSKQYYFQRVRDWLTEYMGENHGVTLGITECGSIDGAKNDASVIAVWYASHLGEFGAAGDVEVFTPWTRYLGMFETIHLFTKYAKVQALPPVHSDDHLVSLYPTINANKDSLTIMVVNRKLSGVQDIAVDISGFVHGGTWAPTYDLAFLEGETFMSASQNALYANGANISGSSITLTVPQVSVTAIVLSLNDPGVKPDFAPRSTVPDDTSGTIDTTDVAVGDLVTVWDYSLGSQVQKPDGTLGGWWYNYADTLSTISAIDGDEIALYKSIQITFDAVTNAEQDFNYAGLGFNWANTPSGENLSYVDLSAYDKICVEYESNISLQASVAQTSVAEPKKTTGFKTSTTALPAVDTKTLKCLEWSEFGAISALDLTRQVKFQIELTQSAEFSIYSIALQKADSNTFVGPQSGAMDGVRFFNNRLTIESHKATTVHLYTISGASVAQFNAMAGVSQFDLSGYPQGTYYVVNGGLFTKAIFIH
jgi:hypothetical protein